MLTTAVGKTTAAGRTNTVEAAYTVAVSVIAVSYLVDSVGMSAGRRVPVMSCILGVRGFIGVSMAKCGNSLSLGLTAIGTGVCLHTVSTFCRLSRYTSLVKAVEIFN